MGKKQKENNKILKNELYLTELFKDTPQTFKTPFYVVCHQLKYFFYFLFITYPYTKKHLNINWNKLVYATSKVCTLNEFKRESKQNKRKHPFWTSDGPVRKEWPLPHLEFCYSMSGPGLPSHHENKIHICLSFFSNLQSQPLKLETGAS